MALPVPNLDDRTFAQLIEEARARIAVTCPDWTDFSPGDPGMTLLDVFAYLTETLLYRLNRVPEKSYIAFLNLLGVRVLPPEAASVKLVFKAARPVTKLLEIPRGTRVSVSRPESGTEAPVFVVAQQTVIPTGQTQVEATAYHCDLVDAELLGRGTGLAGLSFTVERAPIIAAGAGQLDLFVAVEAKQEELAGRVPAREFNGQSFRVWREVDNFAEPGADAYVYVADRTAGTITFAPSLRTRDESGSLADTPVAIAAVPPAGRDIRAWYATGGGSAGNVAAGTLTVLKSSVPGVSVSNPEPAMGGKAAETVENALLRGPHEVHSLQRAVTARDFELLARRSGAISRARAFTKASLWTYATPGTVEVVLVPAFDQPTRGARVSCDQVKGLQTDEARSRIQELLDDHRPLGTKCVVSWAHYKTVKVRCRIVAHADEDAADVRARVLQRLYDLINPLPSGAHSGWRFGQALRSSQLFEAALAEPGVIYVDKSDIVVEDVPKAGVQCLAADAFQPNTWYAGSSSNLFRSMDEGDGWVTIKDFAGERVYSIQPNALIPGLVAVVTQNTRSATGSHVYLSSDCGENWTEKTATGFEITDVAWVSRDGTEYLFFATAAGLYQLSMKPDASLEQILVRPGDEKIGYYAIAVAHLNTGVTVAVASRAMGGVYLSDEAGKSNTFRSIGKAGEDVRVLSVQTTGARSFLWAGLAAPTVEQPGKGCSSWSILGNGQDPPEDWQNFNDEWMGGSCVELAFQGDRVLAATYDAGVIWLERRASGEVWHTPDISCGLPQSSREHPFERVDALGADPEGKVVLAGGSHGVFRSRDASEHYTNASCDIFADKVTLPPNWLFCSGEHEIEVVTADESRED